MLSCALINVLGFFDLMYSIFEKYLNLTCMLTLTKYSDLIKLTSHFQNQCNLKRVVLKNYLHSCGFLCMKAVSNFSTFW